MYYPNAIENIQKLFAGKNDRSWKDLCEAQYVGSVARVDLYRDLAPSPELKYWWIVRSDKPLVPYKGGGGYRIVTGATIAFSLASNRIMADRYGADLRSLVSKGLTRYRRCGGLQPLEPERRLQIVDRILMYDKFGV